MPSETDLVVVDRLWTECSHSEGGVVCSGVGAAKLFETFTVGVNGHVYDVVVTTITTGGPKWTAIDQAQFDRRYRTDKPV
jgi:hypothetical protein